MALGTLLCSPYVLYLIAPDLKCEYECHKEGGGQIDEYLLEDWFMTFCFVYFSFINGVGQGVTVVGVLVYTGQCC